MGDGAAPLLLFLALPIALTVGSELARRARRAKVEGAACRCGACARRMRPLPADRAARALRPGHRHEARLHGAEHLALGCPEHPGAVTVLTRLPLLARLHTALPCATCGFYTLEVRVTTGPGSWAATWHERCVTCGAEDAFTGDAAARRRSRRVRHAEAERLVSGVWTGQEPPPPDPLLLPPRSTGSTPPMGAR